MPLGLTRKLKETIHLFDKDGREVAKFWVSQQRYGTFRIAIECPPDIKILRGEHLDGKGQEGETP